MVSDIGDDGDGRAVINQAMKVISAYQLAKRRNKQYQHQQA